MSGSLAEALDETVHDETVNPVAVGGDARQLMAARSLDLAVFFRDTLKNTGEPAPEVAVIPPGSFWMGSRIDEYKAVPAEMPRHEVHLHRPYAMTRGAIRRREYNEFLKATDHRRPRAYSWDAEQDCPVYNVSFQDAVAYAGWLSEQTGAHYRLPTEAEWEYAARAGTDTMFCFGDKIRREEVNCTGGLHCTRGMFICGIGRPVPVASLPANAWGLFEVHGNVQEFTLDHWRPAYRANARAGDQPFVSPSQEYRRWRVVRGGSWFDGPGLCRSASRSMRRDNEFDLNLGFRLVREL